MVNKLAYDFFFVLAFSRPYLSNGRAIGMVVVCMSVRPAKRCEIGPTLLLITNRKSHISFQMK